MYRPTPPVCLAPPRHDHGASLIEVLIGIGLVSVALVPVAHLFALATGSLAAARDTTLAAMLARQKMEQLRSPVFGIDSTGATHTDTGSDLASSPERAAGGVGLLPSPSDSLGVDRAGYVDYLDQFGRWVGAGPGPPPSAVFVRRWSIAPLPADPGGTLVFQVLVAPRRAATATIPASGHGPGVVVITGARTRKPV